MRDLMNRLTCVSALAPGALRTASANGASIDVTAYNAGNDGLCFEVHAGTITDGTHAFKLQDNVDNAGWNDVAAPYVQTPSGQTNQFTSATTGGTIIKFGYLGNPNLSTMTSSAGPDGGKVLVRLVSTVTGSPSTGGYYSAVAILGDNFNQPAA